MLGLGIVAGRLCFCLLGLARGTSSGSAEPPPLWREVLAALGFGLLAWVGLEPEGCPSCSGLGDEVLVEDAGLASPSEVDSFTGCNPSHGES
jgi:hypothetical protein